MKRHAEIVRYRAILEQKLAELLSWLPKRDDIVIEKSADELDEVQRAAERELAVRNLDREARLIRDVRAALRRISAGSFGICLHCEEEISPKRLAALPWASLCIRCQAEADGSELTALAARDSLPRLQDAA
ncbi:MAG: TraR/DksA family transcriptional regulator [Acidobacteriota bacterium]